MNTSPPLPLDRVQAHAFNTPALHRVALIPSSSAPHLPKADHQCLPKPFPFHFSYFNSHPVQPPRSVFLVRLPPVRDSSHGRESWPNRPPLLIPSAVHRSAPCACYYSGDSRGRHERNWACGGCVRERRQGIMAVIVSTGDERGA